MVGTRDGSHGRLVVLGVDHHVADAAVRAQLSLDDAAATAVIQAVRGLAPDVECMILSTCNRTELVLVGASDIEAHHLWHRVLVPMAAQRLGTARSGDGAAGDEVARNDLDAACLDRNVTRQVLGDRDAAIHIFGVASGIGSQLLGDEEVLGQLRAATRVAEAAGGMGKVLHKTMRMAMETGRQARATTEISVGGAGIGAAVASTVAAWERQHGQARVLLAGAGPAAASIATQLDKHTTARVTLVNRTRSRAEQLAARFGAGVCDWDALALQLDFADILVAATRAPEGLLTGPQLGRAVLGRDQELLVIDAGLPAQVGPAAGARLVGLDRLRDHREQVTRQRQEAVSDVSRLVDVMATAWLRWRDGLAHERRIVDWYRMADLHQVGALAAAWDVPTDRLANLDRVALRSIVHDRVEQLRRQPV